MPKTSKMTVKKLASKVGRMQKEKETKELTYFHNAGGYSAVNQLGTYVQLTQVPAGTEYNERVGREIKPTHAKVQMLVRGCLTNSAINQPIPYRIIVFQDRAYSGGIVRPIEQILEIGTSPAAGDYKPYTAGYNDDYVRTHNNKQNPVSILKDRVGWMSPCASGYGNIGKVFRLNVSGKYLSKVSFAGAALTDARAGAIFVYFLGGTSATVADNNQTLIRTTLSYYDD